MKSVKRKAVSGIINNGEIMCGVISSAKSWLNQPMAAIVKMKPING